MSDHVPRVAVGATPGAGDAAVAALGDSALGCDSWIALGVEFYPEGPFVIPLWI